MKHLFLFAFLLAGMVCYAQNNNLLLENRLITDLSEYPVYKRITVENGTKRHLKPAFSFVNDLEIRDITYLSDGLKVKGLLIKPKREGNYPCIIFNRGGNRDFGALTIAHATGSLGKLANEGYVVIASQYRGNAGGEGVEEFGGAEINDVLILPEVLKEVPGADVSNIGLYGWSRGGMMTFLALAKGIEVKAAAVGGAISDHFAGVADRPLMEEKVYAELIPDYVDNKEEALRKRSAIAWPDQIPKDIPILMLHGNADWRVKVEQCLKLALEFEKYRIPYRLKIFEGGDHGISNHKDEVFEEVKRWFDRFLKNGEAVPDMEFRKG